MSEKEEVMGFKKEMSTAIAREGLEVDFHWITDSIYNQEL